MQELNKFKTDINLAEFATAFGYYYDKKKSSRNAPVMRHKNGDKIVVGRDIADQHYIYFNPNNDNDKGSIIDFVQNRTGESLGYIRKRLRQWLRNPQPQVNITVTASSKDAMKIANEWAKIETDEHIYSDYMGIKRHLIEELVQSRKVKKVGGDLYFMLSDPNGICGFEKRTADGGKYIQEGSRKGIFTQGDLKNAERIVFFESPLDMLAYKQLEMGQEADFYVCTMGSIGETAKEGIQSIFEYNKTAIAIYATDNDKAGEDLAKNIAQLDQEDDREHKFHRSKGKDWKDDLEDDLDAKIKKKSYSQSRGGMRRW